MLLASLISILLKASREGVHNFCHTALVPHHCSLFVVLKASSVSLANTCENFAHGVQAAGQFGTGAQGSMGIARLFLCMIYGQSSLSNNLFTVAIQESASAAICEAMSGISHHIVTPHQLNHRNLINKGWLVCL